MASSLACPSASLVGSTQLQGTRLIVAPRRLGRVAYRRVTAAKLGGGRFDEGADQVRRLLDRDRNEVKQFGDIGGSLSAEFDEGSAAAEPAAASSQAASSSSSSNAATATVPKTAPTSPFGGAAAASPFGASSSKAAPTASPFDAAPRKPLFEPEGLRPDLPPAPLQQDPWWKKITLTQVVIVLSFTTIIGLMLATFWVVLTSGGVHLNDD